MKRILTVLLEVLMLASSIAVAETDQVITFMDIPWETPAGEYVETIKEVTEYARPDEKWFPPLYAPINGKLSILDPDTMEEIEEEASVGFSIAMNSRYMQKEQQIAGYPLFSIKGCTVNRVSNGVVIEDRDKSIVVEMSYQLDVEKIADLKIAYDDLKQKLCSLYGECDNTYENVAEWSDIIRVEKSIWYGENTYVFLHLSRWPNIDRCTLEIAYGRRDVKQLIESVKNPDMVATMPDPNDVSGL